MFGTKHLLNELQRLTNCWMEVSDRTKRIESKLHTLASAQGVDLSGRETTWHPKGNTLRSKEE